MDKTVLTICIGAFRTTVFPILMVISGIITKLVSASIQWKYVGMTLLIIGGFECFITFLLRRIINVHGMEYEIKVGDGERLDATISVDPEDEEE